MVLAPDVIRGGGQQATEVALSTTLARRALQSTDTIFGHRRCRYLRTRATRRRTVSTARSLTLPPADGSCRRSLRRPLLHRLLRPRPVLRNRQFCRRRRCDNRPCRRHHHRRCREITGKLAIIARGISAFPGPTTPGPPALQKRTTQARSALAATCRRARVLTRRARAARANSMI